MIGRLEQNILPSYHTKKPVPAILSNHRGEPFFLVSRFHPICRIHFSCEKCRSTTSLDDNGITGPDWGHSEVVFRCFPIRRFQHFTSLSEMFHILLFSSSCSLSLMSESGLLRTRRSGVLTPDTVLIITQELILSTSSSQRFPQSLSLIQASTSLGIYHSSRTVR